MKNSIKRTLSLLLALVMVLSLGLPAYAVDAADDESEIVTIEDYTRDTEIVPIEEPGPEYEEIGGPIELRGFEELSEAQFRYYDAESGFGVDVYAPEGALPEGTEMRVERLADLSGVQAVVDGLEKLDGDVRVAADISFWYDGKEIEPADGAKLVVNMTAPEIEGIAAPVVLHIPDGEDAVPELVDQIVSIDSEQANAVRFEAADFSVYAIIDGSSGDLARLKVIFKNGTETLAEYYIKKADLQIEGMVAKIIADPGVPEEEGKLFMGWTTDEVINDESEHMDIGQVRALAIERLEGITEGGEDAELTVYAMMVRVFYLYYAYETGGNTIIFKTETVSAVSSAQITVNADFTPTDQSKGLLGWYDKDDPAGSETQEWYKNGERITLTKDTTLLPKLGTGVWIHFDENDGGAGVGNASYTPPVFVPGTENAKDYKPKKDPTRPGYTFDNWYTEAEGGTVFNFDQVFVDPPAEGYTVYAHWTPNETASYKVVIWAQSVNDAKDAQNRTYDYVNFIQVDNVPTGTLITNATVAPYKNYGDTYFGVSDLDHDSKAFQYSRYEIKNGVGANKDGVSSNNDTIVNVYYDRRQFTISFKNAPGATSQTYYEQVEGGEDVYGLIDGNYVHLSVSTIEKRVEWGTYETYGTAPAMPDPVTNVRLATKSSLLGEGNNVTVASLNLSSQPIGGWQYTAPNGKHIFTTDSTRTNYRRLMWRVQGTYSYSYNGEPYEGMVYKKVTETALVYTGLYGQPLSKYNYSWPDGRWSNISFLSSFNGNLFGHSNLGSTPNRIETEPSTQQNTTIIFYLQDANNPSSYPKKDSAKYQISTSGGFNITNRFVGTTPVGYKWSTSETMPGGTWDTGVDSNGITSVKRGSNTYLHIKYDLQKFDIVFRNGDTEVKRVSNIRYGQNIAGYAAEAPTITAGDDSHYFSGWYLDPLGTVKVDWNTTMPLANKVVYAKIAPVEYHVIVELNGGSIAEDATQKTNFWVPYETVLDDSVFMNETGQLIAPDDQHSIIGYYTDAACTVPWDFSTKLTADSLTIQYTGPDDPVRAEYGDDGWDSTVGVFKLYAKWRDESIAAAGGIQIRYKYINGTTEAYMFDSVRYADEATVITHAAPLNSTWPNGKKFDKWQLGTTGSENVQYKYPTQDFAADSQYVEMIDGIPTITLEAVYVDADPILPTHIYWYANTPAGGVMKEENVKINVGVDIPTQENWTPTDDGNGTDSATEPTRDGDTPAGLTYEGHAFLGWARLENDNGTLSKDPATLDIDDLFLKWFEGENGAAGHYEAQDKNGDWVPVTQVACDEKTPYHDLYAVWAGAFYVVYTGQSDAVANKASFTIYDKDGAFDLTQKQTGVDTQSGEPIFQSLLTPNTLYGGYYTSATAPADGAAYDGSNWTFDTAGTVAGNAIKPVEGATYYVKEVPNTYLTPKLAYTFFKGEGGVGVRATGAIWLLTFVDSSYDEAGFIVEHDGVKDVLTASLSDSFTFRGAEEPESAATTVNPPKTGNKIVSLRVMDISRAKDESGHQIGDKNFLQLIGEDDKIMQYWVTPDGCTVTGCVGRGYVNIYGNISKGTVDNNCYSMTWTETPAEP